MKRKNKNNKKQELKFTSHAEEMLSKRHQMDSSDLNITSMYRITRDNYKKFEANFPHITNKFRSHMEMTSALVDKVSNVALMISGYDVVTVMYADGKFGYNF